MNVVNIGEVEIRGSVNIFFTTPTPEDLNGMVAIRDFLRTLESDDMIVIEVDGNTLFAGNALDASKPFNFATQLLNSEGNIVTYGTEGNDFLIGTHANDTLVGGDGDDLFIVTDGSDVILGGKGKDAVLLPEINPEDLIFDFDGPNELFLTHVPSGIEQEFRDIEILELNGVSHDVTDFFI